MYHKRSKEPLGPRFNSQGGNTLLKLVCPSLRQQYKMITLPTLRITGKLDGVIRVGDPRVGRYTSHLFREYVCTCIPLETSFLGIFTINWSSRHQPSMKDFHETVTLQDTTFNFTEGIYECHLMFNILTGLECASKCIYVRELFGNFVILN